MYFEQRARTVSTLVCHAHIGMAIECLGSIGRFIVDEDVNLRIHDDGSLTAPDMERLLEKVRGVSIIPRKLADERVADEMGRYKRLIGLRSSYPNIMKAIDGVLWCDEAIYACVDSDVLFMRPMRSPFRLPPGDINAVLMSDRAPSYSMRSWGKLLSPGVKLPRQANSGFVICRRDKIDFELFEWFLSKPRHRRLRVIEQTLWSMLAMRIGGAVLDPARVRVMRAGEDEGDLAIGHFTARTRELLPAYYEKIEKCNVNQPPIEIALVNAGECTVFDLLYYEYKRGLSRLIKTAGLMVNPHGKRQAGVSTD